MQLLNYARLYGKLFALIVEKRRWLGYLSFVERSFLTAAALQAARVEAFFPLGDCFMWKYLPLVPFLY
jgi:hypothetical protein